MTINFFREVCHICQKKESKINIGGVSYCSAKCINNDIAVYQDFIKQLREGKKELRMEKGVE
jgi:hypothetical protein